MFAESEESNLNTYKKAECDMPAEIQESLKEGKDNPAVVTRSFIKEK